MLKYNQQPRHYEIDRQYKFLINSFRTNTFIFKYPYTLTNYRRGINPVCALYEELQASLLRYNRTKFDVWLIEKCKELKSDIVTALEHDCIRIKLFMLRYEFSKPLESLLNKFVSYLTFFKFF